MASGKPNRAAPVSATAGASRFLPTQQYCTRSVQSSRAGTKDGQPNLGENGQAVHEDRGTDLDSVVIAKGYITLPKSKTPHRITENADVFTFGISAEDMATLDSIEETYGRFNTGWEPMNMD